MTSEAYLFTHHSSTSHFTNQHLSHHHPSTSLNTIVRMLRTMSGTETKQHIQHQLPYFSIDNEHIIYTRKSEFIKNGHARYTFERYER
jgi:hypothetical protein